MIAIGLIRVVFMAVALAVCEPAVVLATMAAPPACQEAREMAVTAYEQGRWPEALSVATASPDKANLMFGAESLQAAKSYILPGDLSL